MLIFELLEFSSFLNFWYWLLVIVTWGVNTQIVLGIPFYIIANGKSQSEDQQKELMLAVHLNARRALASYSPRLSLFLWILAGFSFGFCAFAALSYNSEPFQAILFLLVPVSFVVYLRLRLARGFCEEVPSLKDFHAAAWRHRLWTICIASISIFLTAFWGLVFNLNQLG